MTQATDTTVQLPACEFQPPPYDGPSREEVLDMRREFLTPALLTYYQEPIMIVDGHMQWLFDETGRRYVHEDVGRGSRQRERKIEAPGGTRRLGDFLHQRA